MKLHLQAFNNNESLLMKKNKRHPTLTATILLDTFVPIKKALKSAFFIQSKMIFLLLLLSTSLFSQEIDDYLSSEYTMGSALVLEPSEVVKTNRGGFFYMSRVGDGLIKEYHDNGQLKSERTYKDGKLDGLIKEYHDNGQLKSEITYKDGKKNGPYTWYWDNGNISDQGAYKDGKLDGPIKVYYYTGELQIEGVLKYRQKVGIVRGYYKNGQLKSEGTYRNDERNGPLKSYFENGKLRSDELFKNDVQVGPFQYYHENGQLRLKGTRKNDGVKDGVVKQYDDSGKLIGEYNWKDDELINSKEY